MLRKLLAIGVATPFVILAIYDLWHGKYRTGVASGLLVIVNALVFWQDS